jgi:hypothetical protein
MPMRKYWNAIEPSVYLTLFSWLAPFREGRYVLREFATSVDPKYAHPTYLGHVVLSPVVKIVEHLMDMCYMEKILDTPSKVIRNNKLRHQATCYIARQYLQSLILKTTMHQDSDEDKAREDEELYGEDLNKRKGVTQILLNLPREYQRWNSHYKKDESLSIEFNYGNKGTDAETELKRPMNVKCPIHPSFKQCLHQKPIVTKGRRKVRTTTKAKLDLRLNNTWDPYYITQQIMEGNYIITDSAWNDDMPTLYQDGEKWTAKPRGNTTPSKRMRNEKPNYKGADEKDDSNEQSEYSGGGEEEETDETTTKTKAKKQKVTNKRKQNEINSELTKELQRIITKRMSDYIPKNFQGQLQTEAMCNKMAKDITSYFATKDTNGNDKET